MFVLTMMRAKKASDKRFGRKVWAEILFSPVSHPRGIAKKSPVSHPRGIALLRVTG